MLLPVETFRDETTNTVYTTTDRMGTYCLVDMELWLDLLGIKPNNDNISQKSIDNFSALAYNGNSTESVNTEKTNSFDVVFMVDQVNYSDEQLDVIKDKITETSTAIWKRTPEATIVIYGYNGDGTTHFTKYGRSGSENPEALNVMLSRLSHVNSIGTVVLSKAVDDLITENSISNNRIYCFTFFDSLYDYTEVFPNNGKNVLNDIESGKYDINISVVSNIPEESKNNSEGKECYATALYNQTNGISIDAIDFVEKALKHIYGDLSNQLGAYNAIIATGYHTIVLDAPITIGYREAAEDVKKNPQNLERYKKSGMVDTDDDGLLDFQEINFEIYGKDGLLVQFDEKGNIKELPLATVCSDLYINTKGKDGEKPLTYVEKGWDAFRDSVYYSDLSEIHILPIRSDPTSVDGDCDGVIDIKDISPLSIKQEVKYSQNLYKDNSSKFMYDQQFNMDFTWFFEDCTKYNQDLALTSIIYAGLAYHTTYVSGPFLNDDKPVLDTVSKTDDEYYYAMEYSKGEKLFLPEVMELYGFEKESIETINLRNCRDDNGNYYNDNHYIQFDIGKKDISQYDSKSDNGTAPQNVVGIFVRGTHGTEEWYSNFDIGNTDEWTNGTDWETKENHMGFDVAAVRAKKEIDKYLSAKNLNKDNTVIWLAGHSRGAAVSGIIATYLIADGYTVYGYNFATPNQVEVADSSEVKHVNCPGVFNIINTDDLVPCLPLEDWNFVKYGESFELILNSSNKLEWHCKGIDTVYNTDKKTLDKTLLAFKDVSINRNGCYNYKYDSNSNIITNMVLITGKTGWDVKKFNCFLYDESFYEQLPENMKEMIYIDSNSDENRVYIYQKPIYFMQLLAGVAAGEELFDRLLFAFGNYTSPYFDKAKSNFIQYTINTTTLNPHWVDAYIIIIE